ncbi:MAG TPA: sensor histidine kinase KdpD [Rhodanobacteraceae bacterium]|nr:sensor histidine kinase KdpD [Rhodanobacteraceae bacterium]
MPNARPDQRPDPDALLARVREEEARGQRGRLKVYFGAAPGVGKSYAMLEAARKLKADGIDVVVGYVELHGRPDTEALLAGLEILPPQRLEHRGIVLAEFDLDAALRRRPGTILVDELAHSNHPGARHPKRWMDIEELLATGIDVHTTVNVQHLESLNDIVTQITGVQVRETVPDKVFDAADEIELVDLPPEELLQRLQEGKVYVGEKARHALESFFRKGNLIALRQLALRATADRVDDSMREYRERHAIGATWPAGERVLVCVGPDPLSARLVRSARRLAAALHADWLAVYVETPGLARLSKQARDRVLQTLKLAESLGAETANLSGEGVAAELLAFARQRNVSKIICGKPQRSSWRNRFSPSLVDEIISHSGDIDVFVITGEEGAEVTAPPRLPSRSSKWQAYAKGVAVVFAITLACVVLNNDYLERTNLVMLYLLGTVLVAVRFGRGPSVVASVLSVTLFDFLFVPPVYSFAVSDAQYLITFTVMLATGLIISNLAARGRRQASVARQRERRSSELYALSRELAQNRDLGQLGAILCRRTLAIFDGEAAVLLPDSEGRLLDPANFCARGAASTSVMRYPVPGNDLGIAQWAYDHRQKAGRNTDTLASADAIYLPLNALRRCIGVLGLRPKDPRQLEIPEQMHLLESFVTQAAVAMERVQLAQAAHAADTQVASEKLRNILLSSISHDFRTPLASIIGATSTLLDKASAALDEERRRSLLRAVLDEAQRLHRLVDNLLDLTRLTSGPVRLKRQAVAIDELTGAVLHRLHDALADREVALDLPADLPLVPCDEVMIEQVLFNLVENAQKHTPPGTPIRISARAWPAVIEIAVADRGPGLPPGEEQRVFEKFHRAREEPAQSGFGLGLSICKTIVEAHGGEIGARNLADGGVEFRFSLPLDAEVSPP